MRTDRGDGVVIRKTQDCTYVSIIEVKHIKKVILQTQKNAVVQASLYLTEVYQDVKRYPRHNLKYFIAILYTYNYPTIGINTGMCSNYLLIYLGI